MIILGEYVNLPFIGLIFGANVHHPCRQRCLLSSHCHWLIVILQTYQNDKLCDVVSSLLLNYLIIAWLFAKCLPTTSSEGQQSVKELRGLYGVSGTKMPDCLGVSAAPDFFTSWLAIKNV